MTSIINDRRFLSYPLKFQYIFTNYLCPVEVELEIRWKKKFYRPVRRSPSGNLHVEEGRTDGLLDLLVSVALRGRLSSGHFGDSKDERTSTDEETGGGGVGWGKLSLFADSVDRRLAFLLRFEMTDASALLENDAKAGVGLRDEVGEGRWPTGRVSTIGDPLRSSGGAEMQ